MNFLSNFAETLGYLMKENELNEVRLSEALGMETGSISRYLHAEYAPSVLSLVAIADFFQCSADYLLGRKAEYVKISFKPCPPFSQRLTHILNDCKKKGISGKRLCEENGISESSLYDWKSDRRQPSLANILKIAEALGFSVDYVLGREI